MEFRTPTDSDWPEILHIANRAVAHVQGAGTQDEWLRNRRTLAERGDQVHFVMTEHERPLGYGSLERESTSPADEYRLFVVVEPERLDTAGTTIYRRLEALLDQCGATRSWFVEYAQDTRFIAFIEAQGYVESRRFTLAPDIDAVVLTKRHLSTPVR